MADASNKKRGAMRQITKDDRPDDDDDEASPSEQGTFARASDEVLATRKIVKVRRSSAAAPSGPNLFANIQLVAPTPTPATTPIPAAKDGVASENANGNGKAKEEEEQGKGKEEEIAPRENGDKNGGGGGGDDTGKAPVAAAAAAVEGPKSFDQVSSSTNAFGSFGSAASFSFSGSSFSFGTSSPAVGFGSFGSSTTTTTTLSDTGKFPLFGQAPAAGDLSVAPSSSSGGGGGGGGGGGSHPTVSLQEVPVETGEEREKAAFAGDGILYEFVDKSWKERGKGELKINLSEDMSKARLVMRSRGNLKLLLNASLFPDMRVSKMDGRSVTFACVNSAAAAATGQDGVKAATLTTYAVKLRDAAGIPEFLGLVEAHKGVKSAAAAAEAAAAGDGQGGEAGGEEQAGV